ncbi:YafY family protein [Cellvibrio sp. PSBB023]|uniref:helix-turn-helix transcriptional regulator n=1 Tax=Cellvibrio sp. PSBB023 TaxID=1945512 RepID=UPI00098F6417|nr:WYL domain-containing protein [Cellvibrio sp. PSBB023]AQT59710.1 WYL domain-containing protein [Cellvibrio sp. PSBB023]
MEKTITHQRFQLLELLAYWEGRVNAKDLESYFKLSRQQSSADINRYKQQLPNNLHYCTSHKAYLPTATFTPRYISTRPDEYLHWFHSGHLSTGERQLPVYGISLSENLQLPARKIAPEIMRGLVAAMRQQKRIDVDYVSLNNPNREGRTIAPHSFINTGLRWHLRAWCEKSEDYRDFVLSRFRGVPLLRDKTQHTTEQDYGWNTLVTIILQPDPRLSPAKCEVLENDYQMQNGQLHITTKGCLVQYLLREMQVSTKMLDGTPEAQQLICVNLLDIKEWLFEG